jgi:hypothetical protein
MTGAKSAPRIADECFIVMSVYGIQRMTKRPGKLSRGEMAIKVRLVVPEHCFAEPDVQVTINVPESAIIKPDVAVTVVEPSADEVDAVRRAALDAQQVHYG